MNIDMTKKNNSSFVLSTGAMLVRPERQQVWDYSDEIDSAVDPDKFFDYYSEREWTICGEPIRDWKAVFRRWNDTQFKRKTVKKYPQYRYGEQPVSDDELEKFMRSTGGTNVQQ